jgi:uncharacterized protein YdaU (DUF1376 family)
MAKDPAFLFYTGDFSTGTQFFSDEQVGKYIRLMMAQHQHGRLSERQMLIICGSYDNEVFSKFVKDANGLYYNLRLESEINKRKAFSLSRSINKLGKKQNNLPKKRIKSYDNHMENENENKDINKNKNKSENKKGKKTEIEVKEYPFSDQFIPVWQRWVDYKKSQFKFQYKTFETELTGIKLLFDLAKGMESDAEEIINQSIGNGWKGFVELKPTNNGKQFTGKKSPAELAAEVQREIAKEYGTNKPG